MSETEQGEPGKTGQGKIYGYLIIAFVIFAYLVIFLKLMFF